MTDEIHIKIGNINSKSPDYVELVNTLDSAINIAGYQICEQFPGEIDQDCCLLEDNVSISPDIPLRIWFFSPKDPEKRAKAEKYRANGEIVCDHFGIKSGELVCLISRLGKQLDQRTAR